jgi:uncharacterized protein YbjT (DUF2867 family)
MTAASGRVVAVAGASGLVGREVVRKLLDDPGVARVLALVRRPLDPAAGAPAPSPRLEERIIDFDRLDHSADTLAVDQVICTLGTTIKKAGSKERFRQVDLGYPFTLARVALGQGARHFLLVSSIGANARSKVFYSRVKGEVEEAILALDYPSVTIARPSLLLGDRGEFRPGEVVATRLAFLAPARYKPVEAADVARVLVEAAREDRSGHRIIESREIRAM